MLRPRTQSGPDAKPDQDQRRSASHPDQMGGDEAVPEPPGRLTQREPPGGTAAEDARHRPASIGRHVCAIAANTAMKETIVMGLVMVSMTMDP